MKEGCVVKQLKFDRKAVKSFGKQLLKSIPPTLVFLTIYFSIQRLFGSENGIIVSSITLVFMRSRSERFIERSVLKTVFIYLILSVLAFLATTNLFSTIVLNLIIPFLLVYFMTDDYKPGGDFPFTMVFMYMQLVPITLDGLKIRMVAIVFGLLIVYIALKISVLFKPADSERSLCKKGLKNMIEQYNSIIAKDFKTTKIQQLKLFEINEKLSELIYNRRKNKYFAFSSAGNYFNFIIIFQHTDNVTLKLRHNPELLTEYNLAYFRRFIKLLEETYDNFDNKNQDYLIAKFVEFSGKNSVDDLMLNTELIFNIDTIMMALNNISSHGKHNIIKHREPRGRLIAQKQLRRPYQLKHKMNVNSFKFCFGIRLAIVMTIAFIISFMINETYSYWLPMSAFLMIRPFYDESKKRIIRRIVGTIIGIAVSFGLFYIFREPEQLFILNLIFAFGMYAMENYAAVVVFATCFALSMVVFASESNDAAWLRLIYTVLGGAISMAASKYILPVKYYDEFKNMADRIINIDVMMSQSLCRLAYNIHEGDMFRELIIESYMVSRQLESMYYASKIEKDDRFIEELLMINNNLVTDMANAYDLLSIQNIPKDYHEKLIKVLNFIQSNLKDTRELINGLEVNDKDQFIENNLIQENSSYINKTILNCFEKSVKLKGLVYKKRSNI